ncbi:MAG: hypothetical protein P3X23_001075 [Thermosynechococcus sp. Uc]|uniref:hypothetical protein n=1 Tax=Thermosynechococcus sp. Uc TaxID=3034853 RepID=UPI0019DE2471|nr:hypothetical protein [Thermosynechococcus sp. Uc]MDM7325699.1 hypothetical protein [Thermosynechococcus sp. Uc]HIK24538.1 hypothetical protein [Thermosynechococcus sp. M46_R2017_013]
MISFLAPTVPIRSLTLDAAHAVLQGCRPSRQRQVLPYLVALYSFIDWWENEGVPSKQDDLDDLPDELTLSTTWCERPEVLDLVDIADLNLEGVQLSLYPVEQGDALRIHCPTFLGVINADLAVAVGLDRDRRQAQMLGFCDRQTLLDYWQHHPADAQGYSTFPLEQLQPIFYLPEQISFLNLPQNTALTTKSNTYNQLFENLPQLTQSMLTAEPERMPLDKETAIQRLLQTLQGYTETSEISLSQD